MTSQKILVITYKFLVQRVITLCEEIDPNRIYKGHHFQGPRGINLYGDCDGTIVLGLPYANLKKAYLCAYVLFPRNKRMREKYTNLFMNWEIVQGVHRIRPVNKEDGKIAEVVMISSHWPSMLPAPPDEVIDQTHEMDWKNLVIEKLDQQVKEFGFLNDDIGHIANVYIDIVSKKNVFNRFQDKSNGLMEAYDLAYKSQDIKSSYIRAISGLNKEINLEKVKLIFLLKNIIKKRLENCDIIPRIKNLSTQLSENPSTLSKTNQWTEILHHFKERYPHFEKFKIKKPHNGHQLVDGVGDKDSVLNFYNQISGLKVLENIDLESYTTIEDKITSIDPIPDGFAIVYTPLYKRSEFIIYVGSGKDVIPIPIKSLAKFRESFSELIQNKKIITNTGQLLAGLSTYSELNPFEINDVIFNERIIKNGNEFPRTIHPEYLFKQYGLPHDVDLKMLMFQLYKVWEKQENLIEELNLRNVIDLEKKIMCIIPKIERAGIGIDVVRLLEYQEVINPKKDRSFVILINLRLKKAKNRDERDRIIDRFFKQLKINARFDALNKIVPRVTNDERIHDRISQQSITGKFKFSVLDRVNKDDQLKSFFCSKPGYEFVIGKYSHYELRIILGLSNDQKNIELLNQDRDIYVELLMMLTGRTEEECKPFSRIGERIFLRLCYMNFPDSLYSIYRGFRNKIGISMSPHEFQKLMINNYVNVLSWKAKILKEAKENGYITTAFGRRLNVSRILHNNPSSLYNYLVKGTGSDGLKMPLVDLAGQLNGLDARIVHITHDEIIVETRENVAENAVKIMGPCMEKPFRGILPNVSCGVDVTIRNTWGIGV